MSLEEQVYLESLEVLSDMDEHEALVRETLDTPPSSPYTIHRGVRRQLVFPPLLPVPLQQGADIIRPPTNTGNRRSTAPVSSSSSMIQVDEGANDDGFHRNNQETFAQIYNKTVIPDAENDYCIPFEDLPEYKAYQCVRTLRRNKRYVWMTFLLLLLSVPVVMRVWTMSSSFSLLLASNDDGSTTFRKRSSTTTVLGGQQQPLLVVPGQNLPNNETTVVDVAAKNSSAVTDDQHAGLNATMRRPP